MSDLCTCGKESEFGCHGISNGEIYDEYYCEECYNVKKRGGTTPVEESVDEEPKDLQQMSTKEGIDAILQGKAVSIGSTSRLQGMLQEVVIQAQ